MLGILTNLLLRPELYVGLGCFCLGAFVSWKINKWRYSSSIKNMKAEIARLKQEVSTAAQRVEGLRKITQHQKKTISVNQSLEKEEERMKGDSLEESKEALDALFGDDSDI